MRVIRNTGIRGCVPLLLTAMLAVVGLVLLSGQGLATDKGATPAAQPAAPTPAAKTPQAVDKPEAAPTPKAKTKAAKPSKEQKETPRLAPGERVNLNTATAEELEKIPGIGPSKAQAIIKNRPYKKPEDIMKVRGIKEKTYQKIKDYITVQ